MEFRDAVKYLRSELGLTQVELANGLNINAITVGRWENGRTRPTRSITTVLLEFARSRGATEKCLDILTASIATAAKEKLEFSGEGLYAVEHASLRQLIDGASFPIYVCDLETDKILYLNQKACTMVSDRESAVGGKCYACLMHRDTPCEFCHKSELSENVSNIYYAYGSMDGRSYRVQGKLIQWNGRRAQVRSIQGQEFSPEQRLVAVESAGEALTPAAPAAWDASADRLTGFENEESTKWLKTIIENINGGVSVVVYEDNGAVHLTYANDRYYELFGYTKEEFEKELKAPHDTVHPEDWDSAAAIIAKVKKTKQAATFRYRVIRRDKSIAYLRCNSSVTTMDKVNGYVLISIVTDITESVQIEQQAIVYGRRLDAIMKNMNSAVTASTVKSDGTVEFLFSNDLYHEMLGYTKEQYQAEIHEPWQCIHPDDLEYVQGAVFGLRSVGDAKELQYRAVTRDGRIKWLRARISIMTFPDAEGPVQLAVYSDVTAAVEAQEKLVAQHNQIAGLLKDTPSGIAIVEVDTNDIEGSIHTVYYNDRFFSYSGYDREEYNELLKGNELSFVFNEDIPRLVGDVKKLCLGEIGVSVDSVVRCHTKDGGFRYLLLTGQLAERRGDTCVINIVMIDITERQEAADRQRINEEMLRIAAETDQRSMIIYDVKANSCRVESRNLFSAKLGDTIENVPQSIVECGIVAPDSVDDFCALFARIKSGEKRIRISLQMRSGPEQHEWFECNAATVFDAAGKPDHAVLVFHNIMEQRVKEAVFKKWQQSISARPVESYTLFRCNISRGESLIEREGKLLRIAFPSDAMSFNSRTLLYAEEYVFQEDREEYVRLLESDSLLAMFYQGEHFATLDYREIAENGELLWRRLTIEMVEYLDSKDVQAFLMYEDINEEKKAEIAERELAKLDPLTGALNRGAFAQQINEIIEECPNSHCALIMLDMDGFKQLNDTFGHAAGDQALQEVAAVLRSYARNGDLVCRLGGDEFFLWLRDVPYDAVISKTAQQICEHVRKAYSQEVLLSASAGIAVYPRDGHSYDELYPKADKALYKVKQSGKGSHAFYSVIGEEQTEEVTLALSAVGPISQASRGAKRRMLIVDDNETNRMILENIFKDEYLIETAKNGGEAMIRLRHFGVSISVVLLDLFMPGVDGFAVLRRMQRDIDLRTIPTVVVTGDEGRATLLKAFELGAAEYVTKPVDVDIIRMRVKAVVSKAENERLRAQNSYLMLQRDEEIKYRTVLESTGTAVIEYDWRNHVFTYDNEIAKHIAGKFDHRGLWQVFLSDMVADSTEVQAMQDALLSLASDREKNRYSKLVKLKTTEGVKHWFRMNIYKNVDDYGLAEKLIVTFNDVHNEVLANDKLLFQATRDSLTGLYNRSGFLEKAAGLIAAREPGYYVIACIDIEKFTVINDQYGTEKGDEVLRHVATTVGGFVESKNGICCRYMADKFAVLYPARVLNTVDLAENHRAAAAPECIPRPLRLRIGRCLVNDVSLPVSAIFDRAAMAENLAKDRYNTHIVDYDESMRDRILREQQIAGNMVDAMQKGEFEPWFQPQYNHATGALIGAEALVRWRRNGKIIPPNDFVSVFEKNGFIYEVDQCIWRQVCALLRRWLDQGKNPLPVSVNISRYDMFQENFVGVLTGLVAEYRLPAELLRLEITESAFSASTNVIKDIAGKLIDAGFTVEIDDFGSGYSSLNTLKDVPASILKLDMRFFETTENSARGGSIVEAIVRMAKWLGMAVIAEGVEDKAQADYLKSIGCYYVQGYYYSKPLTVGEYEKQMQQGHVERKLSHIETLQTLDSDLFWDPKSMETLIFNSYVGGACIFEYHDGESELLRYNNQFISELNGIVPESVDIQDIKIAPLFDEKSEKEFHSALQEALDTGKAASSEIRLTKGEQTEIVRQTSRVIAKMNDSTLYYCVIQNLTEQRKLEQERSESAERLSVIMSNVNGGVSASIIHDENHVELIFANDGYYELFGYTKEQLETERPNVLDLIAPEDREKTFEIAMQTIRKRGSSTYENRCRKRDGSVIWVQVTNTIISLAGVSDTVLLAVLTDITALRRAQEEGREISDRLSAVMNTMTNGVTALTLQPNVRVLFANERYYEMHCIGQESRVKNTLQSAFSMIHSQDRERIFNTVMSATEVGQSTEARYRLSLPDGTTRYVKMEITVTNLIGIDAPVQVAIYTDITDEQKANDQISFLNESAGEILAQPDSEKAINDTLRKLMNYFAGERAYIFELDDEAQTSDNTYEYCAPGVSHEIQRLKNVPYDTQLYWFDSFNKVGFVAISDVAAIDESNAAMRELLSVQNIRAIIVAPLWRDDKLIGYVGVDNPTKAVEQVSQLIALADYLAVLLTRRDLMKAVEHGRQTVQQLMDDTPGAFLRMQICPDNTPTIISFNAGFCRMLGMTGEEVMAEYKDNAYKCVVPEDIATLRQAGVEALAGNGRYTCKCRIKRKDGAPLWVQVLGRFVRNENGELFRNTFFSDITEQRSVEQLQIDLLDNLPFGAAMYEYDGKSLKAIHINRQYKQLVDRDVDISRADYQPTDGIHPDDRKHAFAEIRAAIRDKRNAACDIRLFCGGGEYRLFHLDVRIVPQENGKYLLCVAYQLITDREKMLKETSERLKLLSDSIPGGIATFRCMPGSIELIYFNDGICALTGYSRDEFRDSSISVLGLIFDEDKPIIKKQIELLMSGERVLYYSVRIHLKNGGYKWVECAARVTEQESENTFLISAVLTDVTAQQEEHERLRVSEEMNRLAIDQSGKIITRYDVEAGTLTLPNSMPDIFILPKVLKNMPEEQIRLGRISPDTAAIYRDIFNSINSGEATGEAIYKQDSSLGWRWLKSRFTTVFSNDGKPVSAVISFEDITDQREKEAIYYRWQNAMAERPEDSYTLVRCNLNRTCVLDSWEGKLLSISFDQTAQTFDSRTGEYLERFVYADDRTAFRMFLNSDTMLAEYHRGHRSDSIDYREQNGDGSLRWLRLTIDMVEYPDSTDVEAYLLFEDINKQKRAELSTLRRAETDALTGVLNRATFAERVDQVIRRFPPQTQHALFILDIDQFKQVNDVFGHLAGDQALTDIANALTRFCRKDDLVGRLGGDEFFVFLPDIRSPEVAAKKAQQICDMTRKALSADIYISTSIGIAFYPQDGSSFEVMYKAADEALYRTKKAGKDGYSFSSTDISICASAKGRGNQVLSRPLTQPAHKARRILIVDDNKVAQITLEAILKDEYLIEKAVDGPSALAMLQQYGTAVSAVLLDLTMPGMSGFEVLDRIQKDERTCTIPVIIVTADEDRETALQVIRAGASELITKPVDAELLRIRVESAVSRAENERLRAQNSYLSIRNTEVNSYRAALERTGTMVIVLDWVSQEFSYSLSISKKLAGQYDARPFWNILVSDKVSDAKTAQTIHKLAQEIASNKGCMEGTLKVRLKTRSGDLKIFQLNMFKELDVYGLASKTVMTLTEAAPEQKTPD